jgi:hypothetical protein
LATQQKLAQKLEVGFNALQKQGKLLTPTTFLQMVAHLALPTEQVEILRETANHVIEAVNDTKPLNHFAFKDGASLLLRAKNNRHDPEMQELFLQEGVDVVKAARPKINGMLQYKAYHLLEKLQTELATVYQQLEEPQKAQQYLKQAKASGISALEEGGYARFVAGFLEGLINFQSSQFTDVQTQALKDSLNLIASDRRPFSQAISSLESKLGNAGLNMQLAYEAEATGGMIFVERFLNLNRDFLKSNVGAVYNELMALSNHEKLKAVNEFRQSMPSSAMLRQILKMREDFDDNQYRAIRELSPFPQTYAEELPHREGLLAKGIKFEPYPNP